MPERPAIMYKVSGSYRPVLWKDHGHTVEQIANGLLALGLASGEHAVIMSQSRPHWTWADLAILSCAAVTVPVYPTLAAAEVHFLVNHSDAKFAFVENERQARKILECPEPFANLRSIIVIEGPCPSAHDTKIQCLTWDELIEIGDKYRAANPDVLKKRIDTIDGAALATIVYTSGTTGVPKGAMLLHSNIHSVLAIMSPLINLKPDDLSLSFLPLSHVYERVGGQFLAIFDGLVMAYAESIESVPKNLQEVRPTILNGVPRFYEKAYQRIQAEVKNQPEFTQYMMRWALSLARRSLRYGAGTGQTDIVKRVLRGELRIADKIVFERIRRRFGGRLRIMVSGAAPLPEEVQTFFECIGMQMLEGYGLTETTAPVACNRPETNRHGTVGRLLPSVEAKIADDGEIMIKGPTVFAGYYKNAKATEEALQDGWFLTGDIGEIDQDGYLHIKDRKKDIIITAGGKHVAPQFIENMYRGEQLISNIVVYGDRRKYITALITLNRDAVEKLAKTRQIIYNTPVELLQHPSVRKELDDLIARKNEGLAQFERIKKYTILDNDFSADADEVTPTFKLKRKVITEKYKAVLDSMYDVQDLELEDTAKKA
jgi:long-chain acyl-CoA synthetase